MSLLLVLNWYRNDGNFEGIMFFVLVEFFLNCFSFLYFFLFGKFVDFLGVFEICRVLGVST
jgi:hypothetical protein